MAIEIDATIAGVNSNSFVTIQEADDEIGYRFDSTAWDAASNIDKTKALVMACRKICGYAFHGVPYSTEQKLPFPRYYKDLVVNISVNNVNSESVTVEYEPIIPENIRLAQILEANEILKMKDTLVNNLDTREGLIRQGVTWFQLSADSYEKLDKTYVKDFISKEAERLLYGVIKTGFSS